MTRKTSKPSDKDDKSSSSSGEDQQPRKRSEQRDLPAQQSTSGTSRKRRDEPYLQFELEDSASEPGDRPMSSAESSLKGSLEAPLCDSGDEAAGLMSSSEDRREKADILGAASQLLSVGVHLIKAIAKDQPPVNDPREQSPGEGTRLVHAVKDFLVRPEGMQTQATAAEIIRTFEPSSTRRRRPAERGQPVVQPGPRWQLNVWMVCIATLMMAMAAVVFYAVYLVIASIVRL